jgi:uncharacterized membrane protein (DUF485 family)
MADDPVPDKDDTLATSSRNSRYGMTLFGVYLILYGGFMYLTAFKLQAMSKPVIAGVNLALVYGIGLIVAAMLLAAIYMYLCRNAADEAAEGGR